MGAVGTILGTFVAWWTVGKHLGTEGGKLAAALCATYIGGSVNFASTATALRLTSSPLLAAAVATDNIVMMLYLAVISLIPVNVPLNEPIMNGRPDPSSSSVIDLVGLDPEKLRRKKIMQQYELPLSGVFLGLLCCSFGSALASWIRQQNMGMAFVALTASFSGVLLNHQSASSLVKGSRAAGSALMSVFFVGIGASCGSVGSVLFSTPLLFAFVLIQISIHLLFMLICGRRLNVPLMHTLTASNANIGGPGTAAGMAAARGWDAMVQPAVLLGCLGYAIANLIGILMSYLLKT